MQKKKKRNDQADQDKYFPHRLISNEIIHASENVGKCNTKLHLKFLKFGQGQRHIFPKIFQILIKCSKLLVFNNEN